MTSGTSKTSITRTAFINLSVKINSWPLARKNILLNNSYCCLSVRSNCSFEHSADAHLCYTALARQRSSNCLGCLQISSESPDACVSNTSYIIFIIYFDFYINFVYWRRKKKDIPANTAATWARIEDERARENEVTSNKRDLEKSLVTARVW